MRASLNRPQRWTGASWLSDWGDAWNRFWFTPSEPLVLAVIRIATGLLLTWSMVVWFLDVDAFFGMNGWQTPENVWRSNDQPWQWSWYFVAVSPSSVRVLCGITLIAALLLTLGLATRLAAIVSLVGLVSAVNRAPLNVFGFDDTLGLLMIPLVIGPAGAVLSLDQFIFARNATSSVQANIALRLLQVQLCIVYFFAGCGKLLGASWWEGTALWGAAANIQYRTIDMTWTAAHPFLVNGVTLIALFWEVSYAALIWPRLTRPIVLIMAVLVHLGIGLTMGMMEFGLAMLVANLAFVPVDLFDRISFDRISLKR
ncbi:MAG: HTTM domain-containing protein [Pirellulales bacterium]